ATDDAGRFAFTAIPAGNYSLSASKAAYVTAFYGATRVGATSGVPVADADGQRISNLSIRIVRGGVITGTVFNDAGRPWPSVSVRVQRITVGPNSEREFAPATGGGLIPSTDDRGMY